MPLQEADEINRYGIQLYHNTIAGIDLSDKQVLEVGCGKGGGASYISRYFKPKLMIGIDLSKEEIDFNIRHYRDPGLSFKEGDALDLPFPDNSFDAVLNVESSHIYPDFDRFLSEVKRVLKPGGHFLFTDLRLQNLIGSMFESFELSGMEILKKEDISENILQALDLDFNRRVELIEKKLPGFFHNWALNFAGAKGSNVYNSFKNGARKYYSLVLRK